MKTNYQTLNEMLQGRCAKSRKLANNTYAIRNDSNLAIRLHSTDILEFFPDETARATSGGWKTYTTKSRLNEYLPHGLSVTQQAGLWYWTKYGGNGNWEKLGPFTDGDTILPDGTVQLQNGAPKIAALAKLKKRVNQYAKLCAESLPLAKPGNGDCWFCSMQTEQGQSLGDATSDHEHLKSHMLEKYVVPSLVYRALTEKHCGPLIVQSAFEQTCFTDCARYYTKRAVCSYLWRRLNK